jgi:tRNA-splicing ligase RtcB
MGGTVLTTKFPQVTKTGRVPVKSWAADIEASAMEQAENLARLPFALHHVALMPDAHPGYGMPIGGVLFADKAVVPYAVGVDIGCGVVLIETDLPVDYIYEDAAVVPAILAQIARDVPVGNGPQAQHREAQGESYPIPDGISDTARTAMEVAEVQLGTLGGGNHFLELQRDEDGQVWFMLHSGSRSVGKKVCDYHHGIAATLCRRWHVELPDKELAFLPWDTDEARAYWTDMNACLAWAEESRRRMAGKAIAAIGTVTGAKAWQVLDVHHNYATFENHYGQNGIVHRKGAVRARVGDRVLIPGSMGTASYVGEGLGNPESFQSCQHGAGRMRGRKETERMVTLAQMEEQMAAAGVTLLTPDRSKVRDESSFAYKDIETVMAASAELVQPTKRLTPLGVVKG